MKSISRRAVLIGLLTAVAISGLAWVIATQGPLAPIKVTVTEARETSLALSLFGIGTIEARRSYAIGPTAAGRMSRVLVDQGDVVSAGQALAEMDPVDMEDRVVASRASAQRARELAHSAEAAVAEAREPCQNRPRQRRALRRAAAEEFHQSGRRRHQVPRDQGGGRRTRRRHCHARRNPGRGAARRRGSGWDEQGTR